jgi:hypothetical protein
MAGGTARRGRYIWPRRTTSIPVPLPLFTCLVAKLPQANRAKRRGRRGRGRRGRPLTKATPCRDPVQASPAALQSPTPRRIHGGGGCWQPSGPSRACTSPRRNSGSRTEVSTGRPRTGATTLSTLVRSSRRPCIGASMLSTLIGSSRRPRAAPADAVSKQAPHSSRLC